MVDRESSPRHSLFGTGQRLDGLVLSFAEVPAALPIPGCGCGTDLAKPWYCLLQRGLCGCIGGCALRFALHSTITPNQRRRARRRRANARRVYWLHKTGLQPASPSALLGSARILRSHHSADTQFVRAIHKEAMAASSSWDTWAAQPWPCQAKECMKKGVINGKNASYCQNCGAHWESMTWTAWNRSKTPKKDRRKDSEKPPKKGKKEKKNKDGNADHPIMPSPFQYAMPAPPAGPWTAQEATAFSNVAGGSGGKGAPSPPSPSPAINVNAEILSALKASYVGREDSMPTHVKELVERTEQESGRLLTKALHSATTALGKAKGALAEAQDAKKAHRNQWMTHLQESVRLWDQQLQEYRRQQAGLHEQMVKASQDLATARKQIHQLNSKGDKTLEADQPEEPEESIETVTDQEEVAARTKLYHTMRAFAGSIGVDVGALPPVLVDDDSDLESPTRKRAHAPTAYACSSLSSCAAGIPSIQPYGIKDTYFAAFYGTKGDEDCVDPWRALHHAEVLRFQVLRQEFDELYVRLAPMEHKMNDDFHTMPDGWNEAVQHNQNLNPGAGLPFDEQDLFVTDLRQLIDEHGAVELLEEGNIVYLRTWCLRGGDRETSREDRVWRTDEDWTSWHTALAHLWHDVLDDTGVWSAYIVWPSLPEAEGHHSAAQILIVQNAPRQDVATLIAQMELHEEFARLQFVAAFLPPLVNAEDVVDLEAIDEQQDDYPCRVTFGAADILPVPALPVRIPDGAGIIVKTAPHGDPALLQAAVPSRIFQWQAVDTHAEGSEDSEDESSDESDEASSNEEMVGGDVNRQPAVIHRLGRPSRRLLLRMGSYVDMRGHIAALLHLDDDDIVEIHQVTVALPGESDETWHLILQSRGDLPEGSTSKLVLMDVEYHDAGAVIDPPDVDRRVCVCNFLVAREHVLQRAQVDQYCSGFPRPRCLVHHENVIWPFQDIRLRAINHATYFKVTLPPSQDKSEGLTTRAAVKRAAEFDSDEDDSMSGYAPTTPAGEPVEPDAERLTGDVVAHAPWPATAAPDIRLDCAPIIQQFEWLDSHFVLPVYDLEERISTFLPASLEWLRLPWYEVTDTCSEVWAYVDGSFDTKTGHGGAGVALFVLTTRGWRFGGATSAHFPVCAGSYEAEQKAAVMALKLIHDFAKVTPWVGGRPCVHLVLDNLSVCRQTDGQWNAFASKKLHALLRGFMQLCECRYGADLKLHHVHSHQGDPGNEAADVLAAEGQAGRPLDNWLTFFDQVTTSAFVEHVGWFWLLFAPPAYKGWDGMDLLFPPKPLDSDEQSLGAVKPDDCWHNECIIDTGLRLHKDAFRILQGSGATFDPVPFPTAQQADKAYHCECGEAFGTGQALALHRRRVHGRYAPEHRFLQGTQCPACMLELWSTQRLQQHLAYLPRATQVNPCFQWLTEHGYDQPYQPCALPKDKKDFNRLDAVPVEGPLPCVEPIWRRQLRTLEDEIAQIEAALPPPVDEDASSTQFVYAALTDVTQAWFTRFVDRGYALDPGDELQDAWLGYLSEHTVESDEQAELIFIAWGSSAMLAWCETLCDGEAEQIVEDAFYTLLQDLPSQVPVRRLQDLRQQRQYWEGQCGVQHPHRPRGEPLERQKRSAPAATSTGVVRRYGQQEAWLNQVRAARWQDLPPDADPPLLRQPHVPPVIFVVHMFSGRRRDRDVHFWLSQWGEQRKIDVRILSADTAVSVEYGDLMESSRAWTRLRSAYEEGVITASLAGPPCETYTEARNHVPEGLSDEERQRWPRPLRDRARFLGLEGLTGRELRQLSQGTSFLMQVFLVFCWHLQHGGLCVAEHPGPPSRAERASAWTTPMAELLQRHPSVTLTVTQQWMWGASSVKPTGFLHKGLPKFFPSLWQRRDETAVRPVTQAIGRSDNGQYRTAALKEYPESLCAGLAGAITDQLDHLISKGEMRFLPHVPDSLHEWMVHAAQASGEVRKGQTFLPDYQGR
eukprot:Skav200695  [mRNA]  locus=scaffold343:127818:138239:+ [translate_table: standard]